MNDELDLAADDRERVDQVLFRPHEVEQLHSLWRSTIGETVEYLFD